MGRFNLNNHIKSSALIVSIVIHIGLLIAAVLIVVATAMPKSEAVFAPAAAKRPHMPPRKLQVSVKAERKRNPPKLHKNIVVNKQFLQNRPHITVPEIAGFRGATGMGGTGSGDSFGSLGFSMPPIKIFGVKGSSDKIFIILSSTPEMMYDEVGGIPAYETIKNEIIGILGRLDPTALFNVAVYDQSGTVMLFERLTQALPENIEKIETWLKPLNAVHSDMGDQDYGIRTIGPGGVRPASTLSAPPVKIAHHWLRPAMVAMQQQADSIFILTQGWGPLSHIESGAEQWSASKMAQYQAIKERAREKLREENDGRRKRGQPPRVLADYALINTYFPGTEHPPGPKQHWYTTEEVMQALSYQRRSGAPRAGTAAIALKDKYSINVIHFIPKTAPNLNDAERFRQLVRQANGNYRTLSGLDAIKSSASSR